MMMTESTRSFNRGKFHSRLFQLAQLLDMMVCKPKEVSEHADILESDSDVVEAILSELVNMLAKLIRRRAACAADLRVYWSSFATRCNVKLDF